MGKINRSFFIAWSIIAVLVFANVAVAATTIGTSITTAGNISTTSSGTLTVDGLSIFTGGASVSKNFEVSGDFKLGINAGALIDTSLEVGGTASISGATTLGSTLTVTGLSIFSGGASSSKNFEVSGNYKLGVNAGGAIDTSLEVGGTASISGLSIFSGGASVSTNFEVGGTASASILRVGGKVASASAVYVAEFGSNAATSSILFAGSGAKGTCIQMKSTTGVPVYCRVQNSDNAFTCNNNVCR